MHCPMAGVVSVTERGRVQEGLSLVCFVGGAGCCAAI
jgi:hypothetical protein